MKLNSNQFYIGINYTHYREAHGRALILDGIIQCTEKDEFSYQEMISFLPLCCHPNPENVLVVGGGDGGVVREVVKHPAVKRVHQVNVLDIIITMLLHLILLSNG